MIDRTRRRFHLAPVRWTAPIERRPQGVTTRTAVQLLAEVAEGVTDVNGKRVKPSQTTAERKAAAWALDHTT
jgi:hypothetical protein